MTKRLFTIDDQAEQQARDAVSALSAKRLVTRANMAAAEAVLRDSFREKLNMLQPGDFPKIMAEILARYHVHTVDGLRTLSLKDFAMAPGVGDKKHADYKAIIEARFGIELVATPNDLPRAYRLQRHVHTLATLAEIDFATLNDADPKIVTLEHLLAATKSWDNLREVVRRVRMKSAAGRSGRLDAQSLDATMVGIGRRLTDLELM